MRLAYYAGASTAAACACLLKAFHQRPNFYSATVYLSQSNACLLILTNLLLILACTLIFGLQRLLYGPLRPIEVEQLSEKAWYAVLDTLLAMPSLREDVGGWLLTMFVLLLAGKMWGWIGEGRVDVLEQQPPANPRLFHARLATSLVVSVMFNMWMLDYCVETVMADPRPGMMVIFTFEFAVLSVFSLFTLARYGLALVEIGIQKKQMVQAIEERKTEIRAERAAALQNETESGQPAQPTPSNEEPIEIDENEVDVPGWEEKRRYLFALEVLTDFVKLVIYIVFFTVSVTFNGLPMHIMRDVYMTFASFSKRVTDYIAYRKATSDMNTRYPDATTEEIRGDACIVCRENMVSWEQPAPPALAQPAAGEEQPPTTAPQVPAPATRKDESLRAKKLPCGHILHLRCLKAWLERQQVCPTCRRPVITADQPAGPGVQGQPGAPGGQPPAAGQNGQPRRPHRQNRARIFNFGPVRIGFLNGPGDQINQVINQLRNGGQPPAGQQGQAANQQGPNHLGLEVPYMPDGQGTQGNGSRSSVPVQLMQIEQRLMQEAQNLGVEQQQLLTLRMMEAELARLRAAAASFQQPMGLGMPALPGPQLGNAHQIPLFPNTPFAPLMPLGPTMMPFRQQYLPPFPPPSQILQGDPSQQLSNGSDQLPRGLVLPEGWSLMPLRRSSLSDGLEDLWSSVPTPVDGVQVAAQSSSLTEQPPSTSESRGAGATLSAAQPSSSQPQNEALGPTDGDGSPWFVPTPTTSAALAAATPAGTATSSAAPRQAQIETHAQPQPELPRPTGQAWSFADQNGVPSASQSATVPPIQDQRPANGAAVESRGQPEGGSKGKVAKVEEAEDTGS